METIALPALIVFTVARLIWDFAKWIGARGVAKADETFAKLEAVEKSVDQLVHVIKAVEKIDGKMDAYGVRQGEMDRKLIEHDIRLRHVEAERHTQAQHLADISRFLSTHGFREREPP